eukprot:821155_1
MGRDKIETETPTKPPNSAEPSASPISNTETCTWVDVNIVLDQYPEETSWDISSTGDGTVLKSLDEKDVFKSPTYSICLENGQYQFTIKDKDGNGLCCDEGEGSYEVTTRDGEILAQGS